MVGKCPVVEGRKMLALSITPSLIGIWTSHMLTLACASDAALAPNSRASESAGASIVTFPRRPPRQASPRRAAVPLKHRTLIDLPGSADTPTGIYEPTCDQLASLGEHRHTPGKRTAYTLR